MQGADWNPGAPRPFPGEGLLRLALRLLALSFTLAGAIFLFFPDSTVEGMNAAGRFFGDFAPLPPPAERFWLTLATGYMALVAALAYAAQRDLRRHRDLLGFLALGKAITALGGFGFYLGSRPAFLYLANFLVDGTITLAVLAIRSAIPSPEESGLVRAASPAAATLGRRAEATLEALLEAMVPRGGPFEEGAGGSGLSADLEAFVSGVGAGRAFGLVLRGLEVSPFVFPPLRFRRFSELAVAERIAVLEAWETSRSILRRQAVHLLKLLVLAHFYSRPEIQSRLGYPHPLDRVPRSEAVP